MDEGVKRGIDKIKKVKDSLHRRAKVYADLGKLDDRGLARAMGAVQRAQLDGVGRGPAHEGEVLPPSNHRANRVKRGGGRH